MVEARVEEIYREGRKWGFKPPGEMASGSGGNNGGPSGAKGSEGVGRGEGSLDGEAGRETPTLMAASMAPAGISGPGTPVGRRGISRESEYFESPLR